MNMKRRLDLWSDHHGLAGIRRKFAYCFEAPAGSDYPPILNAHEIAEPFAEFDILGAGGPVAVSAFGQRHGRIRSLGFRFGPFAYSPDVDGLDDDAELRDLLADYLGAAGFRSFTEKLDKAAKRAVSVMSLA